MRAADEEAQRPWREPGFEGHDQRDAAAAEASCEHVPTPGREGSTEKAANDYARPVKLVEAAGVAERIAALRAAKHENPSELSTRWELFDAYQEAGDSTKANEELIEGAHYARAHPSPAAALFIEELSRVDPLLLEPADIERLPTPSRPLAMVRLCLARGEGDAAALRLRESGRTPSSPLHLYDWNDTALYAVQRGMADTAELMLALAKEQLFLRTEADDLDEKRLAELLLVRASIPAAHQKLLCAHLRGQPSDARDEGHAGEAQAWAETRSVLARQAPLLEALLIPETGTKAPPRARKVARIQAVLGFAGLALGIAMLVGLFAFGSSWRGPSSEPPRRRHTQPVVPEPPPAIARPERHLTDEVFDLRLAILRARPCVCASALSACRALDEFDRAVAPSCSQLAHARADLDVALRRCGDDEARQALAEACPTPP